MKAPLPARQARPAQHPTPSSHRWPTSAQLPPFPPSSSRRRHRPRRHSFRLEHLFPHSPQLSLLLRTSTQMSRPSPSRHCRIPALSLQRHSPLPPHTSFSPQLRFRLQDWPTRASTAAPRPTTTAPRAVATRPRTTERRDGAAASTRAMRSNLLESIVVPLSPCRTRPPAPLWDASPLFHRCRGKTRTLHLLGWNTDSAGPRYVQGRS